ncbi:zinc finger protein 83 [Folsomia candida]|uniref:zinc finger protein 83 n=1 Tax=Folsomia candida TaxID=158441 RepID=UPI000B9089C1|nr:zinc finger protein 83 [Folsomia candida]
MHTRNYPEDSKRPSPPRRKWKVLKRKDNFLHAPSNHDNHHVPWPPTSNSLSNPKKIFPCKICFRPFTNATSAARHAHTHLNPHELEKTSMFHAKYPHCEKMFFIPRDFTNHLFVHLSPEERAEARQGWRQVCYFCSNPFQKVSHLSRHLVTHTTEKLGGRCHICRKTFTTNDSLALHRFAAHLSEEEKVALVKQGSGRMCLFCQKILPDNRAYRSHLASHTKEKPFRCDQCEKQFSAKSNLNLHKRIHTSNPKWYKCDECGQAFSHKHHLTRHQKTVHRKLKDIACLQCPKMFGTKSDMVTHVNNIHLKRRHPCPQCGHTFSQKSGLRRHLKKIHPQD